MAGGIDSECLYLASCEEFDRRRSNSKWLPIAPMKTARYCAAAAVFTDKAFVFGGCDAASDYATVEEYDVKTGNWTLLEMQMAVGRSELAAARIGNRIYLVGGCRDEHKLPLSTVDCFDPNTKQFCEAPPIAKACRGLAAASSSDVAGHLLLFGGTQESNRNVFRSEFFDRSIHPRRSAKNFLRLSNALPKVHAIFIESIF